MRLFFHLETLGNTIADEVGVECTTLEAAIAEATAEIRATVADHLTRQEPLALTAITITDEAGRMLSSISLADALKELLPACFRLVMTAPMWGVRHLT